jgi:hypothetical protein
MRCVRESVSGGAHALLAALTLGLSGCGGGGGGGGSGGGGGGGAPIGNLAPAAHDFTTRGANVRFLPVEPIGSTNRTLRFFAGTQFSETPGGAISGSYAYSASANSATISLVTGSSAETYQLTFLTATGGDFSFRQTVAASGAVIDGRGTFADFKLEDGSGPGGNPGNPGGGNPAGGLDGRSMRLTRATGQTHTFTFTGTLFHDSDPPEEGDGTYSFARTGADADLRLHYLSSSGPVNLAGDRYEIRLSYLSELNGTYNGTYTANDGAILPQSGTFVFDP